MARQTSNDDTASIRILSEAEIADIAGGRNFITAMIDNYLRQMENAPPNSTLVGCSPDFEACSWQSN